MAHRNGEDGIQDVNGYPLLDAETIGEPTPDPDDEEGEGDDGA